MEKNCRFFGRNQNRELNSSEEEERIARLESESTLKRIARVKSEITFSEEITEEKGRRERKRRRKPEIRKG